MSNRKVTRRKVLTGVAATFALACVTETVSQPSDAAQSETLPIFNSERTGLRGLIYRPPNHNARNDWPLAVWLHGFSLRGDDPTVLMSYGLPRIISDLPSANCVMIAPQMPRSTLTYEAETLDALIEEIAEKERADADRIIFSGASLGGSNSWDYMAERPGKVIAYIGIASGASSDSVRKAGPVMARLYHGDRDTVVRLEVAERTRNISNEAGGSVDLRILPGVGHDPTPLTRRAFLDEDSLGWALALYGGEVVTSNTTNPLDWQNRPLVGTEQLLSWITLLSRYPHRLAGTPSGHQAEDDIEAEFRRIDGLEVGVDEMNIPLWQANANRLSIGSREISVSFVPYSGFTPEGGLSAQLVYARNGSSRDFRKIDARGKIAVVDASETRCRRDGNFGIAYPLNMLGGLGPGYGEADPNFVGRYFQERNAQLQAQKAGAIGLIVLLDKTCVPSEHFYLPYDGQPKDMPALYAARDSAPFIRQAAKDGTEAHMTLLGTSTFSTTKNVWARLPGRTPSTVLVTSHHDAVGPGVIEDGSGVAQVLGAAWSWAQVPQQDRPCELWFVAAAGHFLAGHGGSIFVERHPDVVRQAKGLVTVEHVSAREAELSDNELQLTGRPQSSFIYTHNGTDRYVKAALTNAPQPQTEVVRAPFGIPLSDAAGFVQGGREIDVEIPFASWISAPLYLLDPRDDMSKLDPSRLHPTAETVAALINQFIDS